MPMGWSPSSKTDRTAPDAGQSAVEALIAFALLALVGLGVYVALGSAIAESHAARQRQTAENLMQ